MRSIFFDGHDTVLLDLVFPDNLFDRFQVLGLTRENLVALYNYLLFQERAVRFLLLDDLFVDVLQVLIRQVLNPLLRQQVALYDGRVRHHVQKALHLVLFLRFHVSDWLIVGLAERLWAEVDPLELEVHLEWEQAPASELLLGEELAELEDVVVLDLVADLLTVFVHVDPSVLEHTILHFHVVKQTVLRVKVVEHLALIGDRLPLSWDIPVVL